VGVDELIFNMAARARAAARQLARLNSNTKNKALLTMADRLLDGAGHIQTENKKDVEAAHKTGLSSAMIDRLTLSDAVMESMAQGLRDVAALPDPPNTPGSDRVYIRVQA